MWADEKKGRKSVYRQGTVQRPDRNQSEPEGQESSSFWKTELEEEVRLEKWKAARPCWALQASHLF